METGTVKWFNKAKGYGFIARESGDDVFVHFKSIMAGDFKTLSEGERVEFEIERGPKGLLATSIRRISDWSTKNQAKLLSLGRQLSFAEAALDLTVSDDISPEKLGKLLSALNRLHFNLSGKPMEIESIKIGVPDFRYEKEVGQ